MTENDVIRQHRCYFLLFCLLKNKWLNICLKNTRFARVVFVVFVANTKKWHDLIFQHAPCPRQKKNNTTCDWNNQPLYDLRCKHSWHIWMQKKFSFLVPVYSKIAKYYIWGNVHQYSSGLTNLTQICELIFLLNILIVGANDEPGSHFRKNC